MRPRKLQIFVSSTYEDLIDYRLAAMEAILAAGHIPAAMEQFSPGDDTAWERIQNWIDQSDGYILILGGRYGSIEPTSGKSYTQLEYEYAVEKKKPLFALVIHKDFHEARVREFGLKVDERNRPDLYRAFYDNVTQKLCRFWSDRKDIQSAIFQKLPEWAQRGDLVGWVRGDEAVSPDLSRELARLSEENRDLRLQILQQDRYSGLAFNEIVASLKKKTVLKEFLSGCVISQGHLLTGVPVIIKGPLRHLGDVFEKLPNQIFMSGLSVPVADLSSFRDLIYPLIEMGLISYKSNNLSSIYYLSEEGRRFRNRLLVSGNGEYRERHFWSVDAQENASDNSV